MTKWVYTFGGGMAEGDSSMQDLLGVKGANLAEMARMGLPVPPGFSLTTQACNRFLKSDQILATEIEAQILQAVSQVENFSERLFGDKSNPLLVSIRSGTKHKIPGLMTSILNLGLNDETVEGLAKITGSARFAYDSYRRFIQMYATTVLNVDDYEFDDIQDNVLERKNYKSSNELSGDEMRTLVGEYLSLIEKITDNPFPQNVIDQLKGAICAGFLSWTNKRAVEFRALNKIPDDLGTALSVQAMAFGNAGSNSATGTAFSRNPDNGENKIVGEYIANAQGEDLTAGLITPGDLTEVSRQQQGSKIPSLESAMPEMFEQLCVISKRLEAHFKQMQELEFTIERGALWILETSTGKCTTKAALRIAVEMAKESLISKQGAVCAIDPISLDQLLHPTIADGVDKKVVVVGLPASPGAASGQIVFNSADALEFKAAGKSAILVRMETSPEDVYGMVAASGVLTQRGGMTSHAAVVARGMGKPAVCGAGTMRVDQVAETISVMGKKFKKGDILTIDGSSGEVISGEVELMEPQFSGSLGTLMEWADEFRRMDVRSNADTPKEAKSAFTFGADGIGLCRTEHMFFEGDRIKAMRLMVLAENEAKRREALDQLLPMQRQDFGELFDIMTDRPVTIRLLDPPLHEFLPHTDAEIAMVAEGLGMEEIRLKKRLSSLRESNPMLGHRGVRLAISFPEIVEMQSRAIFEAALNAMKIGKLPSMIEIMVPLVSMESELNFIKQKIDEVANDILGGSEVKLNYMVGVMIELPRAAIQANSLAKNSDFFSYGTNDLTQSTLGISRDDASQFISTYEMKGILPKDPFATLDIDGVGKLIELSVEQGRRADPHLKLGVCGEHAGDPVSIEFFEKAGMDYVSCSPFRVPIARLAAAQASIRNAEIS